MNTLEHSQYSIRSAWDVGLMPDTERNRIKRQRNRATKRGVAHDLTALQWYAAVAHFGGCCAYCGVETVLTENAPDELTLDHWTPFSCGGGLTAANILPSCRDCNESKDCLHPFDWLCIEFGDVLGVAIWCDCVAWLARW